MPSVRAGMEKWRRSYAMVGMGEIAPVKKQMGRETPPSEQSPGPSM